MNSMFVIFGDKIPGLENRGILEKVFRFLTFQCTKNTGHRISTQKEHPIHHSPCTLFLQIITKLINH